MAQRPRTYRAPQNFFWYRRSHSIFDVFRSVGTHGREAMATASVNVFMQNMYFSISETMPTRFLGPMKELVSGGIHKPDLAPLCFRLLKNGECIDDEETREKLLQALLQDTLEGPTTRLMKADPAKMAFRELPPGNWAGLFMLYQAHCLATKQEAASRSTFYACTVHWRKCLKFRKKSQHSMCLTCDRLKSEMRHAKGFLQHAKYTDQLLGHLAMTWRCREKYWEARSSSQGKADQICLITDGYDKSKPCLPRWAHGRAPKGGAFDKHPRTGMQLSAVMAHGWGCALWRELHLGNNFAFLEFMLAESCNGRTSHAERVSCWQAKKWLI